MVLSALATRRRGIVIQWCVNQIGSPMFVELHEHGEGGSNLLRHRLQMLTAITLTPLDESGVHLLDDDANWQLIQRELKIDIGQFFSHANSASWGALMNQNEDTPSLTERSKFDHLENENYVIEPELVADFPSIAPYSLGVCLKHWGFIGGRPEITPRSKH